MILEFTGISGAGKSTIVRSLYRWADENKYPSARLGPCLFRYVLGRWTPRKFLNVLPRRFVDRVGLRVFLNQHSQELTMDAARKWERAVRISDERMVTIRRDTGDEADLVKEWVNNCLCVYTVLKELVQDDALFFWEEGIAHRAVNLFADGENDVDSDALRIFLKEWLFADILICVDVDADVALDRIQTKGVGRRIRGYDKNELSIFLRNCGIVVALIKEEAHRRHLPVIVMKNNFETLEGMMASREWSEFLATVTSCCDLGIRCEDGAIQ